MSSHSSSPADTAHVPESGTRHTSSPPVCRLTLRPASSLSTSNPTYSQPADPGVTVITEPSRSGWTLLVASRSGTPWNSSLEVSAFFLFVLRVLLAGRGHGLHLGDLGDGHVPEDVVIRDALVAVDGDVDDHGPVHVFGICQSTFQIVDVLCPDHVRTEALRAFREVYGQNVARRFFRVEADGTFFAVAVVGAEAVRADGAREGSDGGEPGVVDQHDGELTTLLDGGDDLGVHHQVGTIATHHVDLAFGGRHLHAEAAGDLVPHARVAVLDVVALRVARPPELVQVPGHGTCRADDDVLGIGERVDRPYDLALGRQRSQVQGIEPPDLFVPIPRFAGVLLPVAPLYLVAGKRIIQRFERRAGVADEGESGVLVGVEVGDVYVDEARCGVLERRLGGGGEVGPAGAYPDNEVGLTGRAVRREGPRRADGP